MLVLLDQLSLHSFKNLNVGRWLIFNGNYDIVGCRLVIYQRATIFDFIFWRTQIWQFATSQISRLIISTVLINYLLNACTSCRRGICRILSRLKPRNNATYYTPNRRDICLLFTCFDRHILFTKRCCSDLTIFGELIIFRTSRSGASHTHRLSCLEILLTCHVVLWLVKRILINMGRILSLTTATFKGR